MDDWTDVPIDYLKQGDHVLVKALERFPVDGIVIDGVSFADESMLTGESMPVEKKIGDQILGGTVNGNGSLVIEARKVGDDTAISHIIRSVEESLGTKAPIQRIADQISAYFVPTVILISIIDFFVWYLLITPGQIVQAFETSIAILVIACPCALGLATPISLLVDRAGGKTRHTLSKCRGPRVRSKDQYDFFDKTGTLTEGKPVVTEYSMFGVSPLEKSTIMTHILAIEETSDHPLAKAILNFGKANELESPHKKSPQKHFQEEGSLRKSKEVSILSANKYLLKKTDFPFHQN